MAKKGDITFESIFVILLIAFIVLLLILLFKHWGDVLGTKARGAIDYVMDVAKSRFGVVWK